MANTTDHVTTAEQLAAMPDDGKRYELVEGVLSMMSPTGGEHGGIAATLLYLITRHARQHELGRTFAAETGYLLQRNPDTVLAPDVSYVSSDRLGDFRKYAGYLPLAPDLAAEVVSPNDRRTEVEAKVEAWLQAGVRLVLVVDPKASSVTAFRHERKAESSSSGLMDLTDVLPGFRLDLAELFA